MKGCFVKNRTNTSFKLISKGTNAHFSLNHVNINGKFSRNLSEQIPVDNGAFRYGYGLFETMLVKDGSIQLMDYHWQRLFSGLDLLKFHIPVLFTQQYLQDQVMQTIKKNKLEALCRVRLQVFAHGGGLYSSEKNLPGFVIECFPLEEQILELNENGLIVGMTKGLAKSADMLSNLKSCNALIYAIAAKQARENKWNDALIFNTQNEIIESTIANIFWVKNEVIYTPPLKSGCIAGVMRRRIIELCTVIEKPLTENELLNADEVFLSNSIRSVRWIGSLQSVKFNCEWVKKVHNKIWHT